VTLGRATIGGIDVPGVLDLGGFDQAINRLSGSGVVTNTPALLASGGGWSASESRNVLSVGSNPTDTPAMTDTFSGTFQDGFTVVPGVNSGVYGGLSLTKLGASRLVLSGYNLASGTLRVAGGVLELNNSLANTHAWAGNVEVSGGTLRLLRSHQIADTRTVTLSGGMMDLNGLRETVQWVLRGGSLVDSVGGGSLQSTSGYDVQSGSISAVLAGGGALVKTGAGTVVLAGNQAYGGGTSIQGGTLQIGNGVQSGSVLGDIQNDAALAFRQAGEVSVSNRITGSGSVIQSGTGVLNLVRANDYSGGTVLESGTLGFSAGALGTSGALAFRGGALRYLSGNTEDVSERIRNSTSAVRVDTGSGEVVWSGNIDASNVGGIAKVGSGVLTLRGSNFSGGGVSLEQGTVRVGNAAALGSGTLSLGTGVFASENSAALTVLNRVILAGDTTFGDLVGSGSLVFAGSATLSADRGLNTAASVEWSGAIGDAGGGFGLTKTGSGTLTLSGANTYGGATVVTGGTLIVTGGSAIADGGSLVVGSAGLVQMGASETVGVLSGQGAVSLGTSTLTVSGAVSSVFEGVLTGSGSLVQAGNGTLTLTAANQMTGGVRLLSGSLLVGHDQALGNGVFELGGGRLGTDTGAARSVGNTMRWSGDFALGQLSGGGVLHLGGGVTLTGHRSVTVDGTARLGGVVSDAGGGFGLTKLGQGALTLGQMGDFSGGVTLAAGTLRLGNDQALGSGALVFAGGRLTADGALARSFTNAVNWTGNAILGDADFSGGLTLAGGGLLSGNRVFTVNSAVSLSGSLDDGGNGYGFSKLGTGTLALRGVNQYTGTTDVSAGVLLLEGGAAIADTGRVQVAALGTLQLGTSETIGDFSGSGTVQLGANVLTVSGSGSTVFQGQISGAGGLVRTGTGTLVLTQANSFEGGTTLLGGALKIGHNQALSTGALSLVSGRISSDGATARILSNAVSLGGPVVFGAPERTGSLTMNGAVTLGATSTMTAATELVWNGAIGDGGNGYGLTKLGSSLVTLSGNNTYTGLTTVGAGTLLLTGGNAIANAGRVQVAAGAGLQLLDSEVVGAVEGAGSVWIGGNTLTVGGVADAALSGKLSGSGFLVKNGSGVWTLGDTTEFTGGIVLNAGALAAGSNSGLGSGNLAWYGGRLSSDGAAARTLANAITIHGDVSLGDVIRNGKLLLSGAVQLTGSRTLWVDGEVEVGGGVGGVSGAGLTKAGVGTLTLGGVNTYTGETVVSAGTLQIAAGASLASKVVSLANSGSLRLADGAPVFGNGKTLRGNGTVVGDVTMASKSTLTLENTAGLSSLTIQGNLSLNGNIRLRLGTPLSDGSSSDLLRVSGALTIGSGASLKLLNLGGAGYGRYDIATYGSGLTLSQLSIDASSLVEDARVSFDAGSQPGKLAVVVASPGNQDLYAWGENSAGALAFAPTPVQATPQALSSVSRVVQVALGGTHSLFLGNDGSVRAAGSNACGQLGDAGATVGNTALPVTVRGALLGKKAVAVAAGALHSVAVTEEGWVYTWGSPANGRLGNGTASGANQNSPSFVALPTSGKKIVGVSAAGGSTGGHTLALDSEGQVYSWGRGTLGQLGTGTAADGVSPALLTTKSWGSKKIVMLAAGETHSLAVDESGGVHAWGDNARAQIGDGVPTRPNRLAPQALNGVVSVTLPTGGTGTGYTVAPIVNFSGGGGSGAAGTAVLSGGKVVSVTLTASGQGYASAPVVSFSGGNGSGASGATAVLNPLANVISVAAGSGHSLAVDASGRVWAWGSNASGQLGFDPASGTSSAVPVALSKSLFGEKNVIAVAAGADHSLAVTEDGRVYAWGSHSAGQLGAGGVFGPGLFRHSPVLVGNAGATGVVASGNRSLFLGGVYLMAQPKSITAPAGPVTLNVPARLCGDAFGVLSKPVSAGGRLNYAWFRGPWGAEVLDSTNTTSSANWVITPGQDPLSVYLLASVVGTDRSFYSNTVRIAEPDSTGETSIVARPSSLILGTAQTSTPLTVMTSGTLPSFLWRKNGVVVTPSDVVSGGRKVGSQILNAGEGTYEVTVDTGDPATTETITVGVRTWAGLAGTYQALLQNSAKQPDGSPLDPESGTDLKYPGRVQVVLTSSGSFSGRLEYEGGVYSIAGSFDPTSLSTVAVINRGALAPPVNLEFKFSQSDLANLTLTAASYEALPAAGAIGVSWLERGVASPVGLTASATLPRAALSSAPVKASGQSSPQFAALLKDASSTPSKATGFTAISVTSGGLVTATTLLGDGRDNTEGRANMSMTFCAYLDASGAFPMYVPGLGGGAYPSAGQFAGNLKLDWTAANAVEVQGERGELEWKKAPTSTGFSAKLTTIGSRYNPALGVRDVLGRTTSIDFSAYAPGGVVTPGAVASFGRRGLSFGSDWRWDPNVPGTAFGTGVANVSLSGIGPGVTPFVLVNFMDTSKPKSYSAPGVILQTPSGISPGVYGLFPFEKSGTNSIVWSDWSLR
jgi:autotransporter-associated beta strand protein